MQQNKYAIWIFSSIAALGGLLFGFNTGIMSGAILFISQQFQLSTTMNAIVVSAVLFGAFFGALLSGNSADRFGRKKLLLICAIIFILGISTTALSSSVYLLIIGRIIVGFAIGICSFVSPLYITEIAPTHIRGALVTLNQLLIVIGIVASYMVDYFIAASDNWHLMLAIGLIPAFALLIGVFFLPESPRWLLAHGWTDKARTTLEKIRVSPSVEAELIAIENSIKFSPEWRALFKSWQLPAIIVGFGLALIQQITGINTIISYAPTFLRLTGIHTAGNAILATVGLGIINLVGTCIVLPLIDKVGRRPLLLTGLSLMSIATVTTTVAFILKPELHILEKTILIGMATYIIGFAVGLGPITWLMIAEIFPLKIRGLAASLATSTLWAANMLVVFSFLPMLKIFNSLTTFSIYTSICIASLIFCYFVIPETKKVSLEQIETNLRARKPCRKLGI